LSLVLSLAVNLTGGSLQTEPGELQKAERTHGSMMEQQQQQTREFGKTKGM
jgi:hypothetical protein